MYSKSNEMEKVITKIHEFIFGVSLRGEVLPEPKPIQERQYTQSELDKWCQEYRFGVLYNKQSIFKNQ